jgi:hypothetical protein
MRPRRGRHPAVGNGSDRFAIGPSAQHRYADKKPGFAARPIRDRDFNLKEVAISRSEITRASGRRSIPQRHYCDPTAEVQDRKIVAYRAVLDAIDLQTAAYQTSNARRPLDKLLQHKFLLRSPRTGELAPATLRALGGGAVLLAAGLQRRALFGRPHCRSPTTS